MSYNVYSTVNSISSDSSYSVYDTVSSTAVTSWKNILNWKKIWVLPKNHAWGGRAGRNFFWAGACIPAKNASHLNFSYIADRPDPVGWIPGRAAPACRQARKPRYCIQLQFLAIYALVHWQTRESWYFNPICTFLQWAFLAPGIARYQFFWICLGK